MVFNYVQRRYASLLVVNANWPMRRRVSLAVGQIEEAYAILELVRHSRQLGETMWPSGAGVLNYLCHNSRFLQFFLPLSTRDPVLHSFYAPIESNAKNEEAPTTSENYMNSPQKKSFRHRPKPTMNRNKSVRGLRLICDDPMEYVSNEMKHVRMRLSGKSVM